MNKITELCEIEGYPDIIQHITDVSAVVDISIQNRYSCGFTIMLDDCRCVNVYHNCDEEHAEFTWMQILNLRERMISEICTVKPGFNPAVAIDLDASDLPKKEGEHV